MSVAVVGSTNSFDFGVVHFPDTGSPTVISVNTGFGGNTVALDGNIAVAADLQGSDVNVYSVADPTAPVFLGTVSTQLGGIGAVAISSNRVVVGEMSGLRISIIDISDPAVPTVLGTKNTGIASISSLAFSFPRAVIAGPNDFNFEIVDFTNPANPSITPIDPQLNGSPIVDFDGSRIAVGDVNGSVVAMFTATGTLQGSIDTQIPSIGSIAIAGNSIAASSPNSSDIAIANFTNPGSPTVFTFDPDMGGGSTIARNGAELAVGAILGEEVKLFTLSTTAATEVGTIDSNIPSIGSIAVADFAVVIVPKEAKISVDPVEIKFDKVPFCQTKERELTVKNTGTADLEITGVNIILPFTVSLTTATVQPNKTKKLTITYSPLPTPLGEANSPCMIFSNAVNSPIVTIPVSGESIAAPPKIKVPGSVFMGGCLPNYFFGKKLTIANESECETLTITTLQSDSPLFLITNDAPVTLPNTTQISGHAIGAGSSRSYIVVFAPKEVGTFNAELTISSNDSATPAKVVDLQGICVEAKPTAFCLTVDYSRSMIESHGPVSKLTTLRSAFGLFLDLLPQTEGDAIAKVGFRKEPRLLVPLGPTTPAQIELCRTEGMTPNTYGAIGEGLKMAIETLTPATTERRVALVFTDGVFNYGTPIADVLPLLEGTAIEVYAVAVGADADIDPQVLSELSVTTEGRFFSGHSTLMIRKDFVQVMADAFRMQIAADPDYVIERGGTVNVPFQLTHCENRVRFACTWEQPEEQLQVVLIAPDGTQFTPTSPNTNRLVRHGASSGNSWYVLSIPPIDGGGAIGPKVLGAWTMRVTAQNLQRESQRFTAVMIVESDLEVEVKIPPMQIGGHAVVEILARHRGVAISAGDIEIEYREPTVSVSEVLSGGAWRRRLAQRIIDDGDEEVVGLRGRAETSTLSPADVPIRTSLLRTTSRSIGRAEARTPQLTKDGVYEVIVKLNIPACGGTVTRYRRMLFAPIRTLSAGLTEVHVRPSRAGARIHTIGVVPRDEGGNRIGPGRIRDLGIAAPGLQILKRTDKLDGSYEYLASSLGTPAEIELKLGRSSVRVPANRPTITQGRKPIGLLALGAFAVGFAISVATANRRR